MAQPQHIISAIVRDLRNDPVAQARVYFISGPVPLPDIAALTDGNGLVTLSVPSTGTYTIGCTAEGFSTTTVTITVTSDQETSITIKLKP